MGKLQVLEMCVARDDEYSLSWYCHPFKLYKLNTTLPMPWLCLCCQWHFELEATLLCLCVARLSSGFSGDLYGTVKGRVYKEPSDNIPYGKAIVLLGSQMNLLLYTLLK